MRNLLLQFGFFFPAAVFAIFVLMVVIGCVANCFGAGVAFYCGVYCKLGIGLLALAAIVTGYIAIR
jgi:hypothetical protein